MIFGQGYYSAMDDQYQGMGLSPKDIGISTPPMKDQLEGLKARIFQGASRVELGFTGRGKGSMGQSQPTPGSYGTEDREAMRDLAKVNKVELSTHATLAVGGLAGLSQGGFKDEERENVLQEINRAIDFAADTARGGAIVVHTGEFPRAISESYGDDFKAYPEEPEKAVMHLVDKVTGKVIDEVRKDEDIYLAEKDEKTGEYLYDKETGRFKTKLYKWKDFEKKAMEWNREHPDKIRTTEEEFYRAKMQSRYDDLKGYSLSYSKDYYDHLEEKKKDEEKLKFFEELEKRTPPEKLEDLKTPEYQNMLPSEFLKKKLKSVERYLEHITKFASGYEAQADQLKLQSERALPIKEYGLVKSAETIAKAGEYAMELTRSKHLPKPLFVAPENLFPESYGAHPQELKRLILDSREKMAKDLEVAYGKEEAKRLADQHIKATFDVGHAYIWRKYFEKKPDETIEDADKRFNNWLAKEVKDLTDEGIIGHVHVSDNFGWADEHVTPGHGRVPIKDFIEQIKKAGIKNVIVEPAHQDFKAMLGGWKEFGSSIYSVTAPGVRRDAWTDVEHSYFGRTAPPMYVVGPFAPSKDWTLWSQTPLE